MTSPVPSTRDVQKGAERNRDKYISCSSKDVDGDGFGLAR
jgi:hypothetical protein